MIIKMIFKYVYIKIGWLYVWIYKNLNNYKMIIYYIYYKDSIFFK